MADFEPGSRIKRLVSSSDRSVDAVVGNMSRGMLEVPDNPGPAVTGRTPMIGQLRRSRDMPVLRDNLEDILD